MKENFEPIGQVMFRVLSKVRKKRNGVELVRQHQSSPVFYLETLKKSEKAKLMKKQPP